MIFLKALSTCSCEVDSRSQLGQLHTTLNKTNTNLMIKNTAVLHEMCLSGRLYKRPLKFCSYIKHCSSLLPLKQTLISTHSGPPSHACSAYSFLRPYIKTQLLSSRFVPSPLVQSGWMRGTVLPGVGVKFPQGSGLGLGLSVGRAGQHGGPGGSEVHRALR